MTLGAGVALTHAEWIPIVRLFGVAGVDTIIVGASCGLAAAARATVQRDSAGLRGALTALALCIAANGTASLVPPPIAHARMAAHLVQPSISTRSYRDAEWSLSHRATIERHVDGLMAAAVSAASDATILVPEDANGLINSRVSRRQRAMQRLFEGTDAAAIFGGRELSQQGLMLNAAYVVSHAGFGRFVAKRNTLPWSESKLDRGQPGVLHMDAAKVGVAICFDSVFSREFRMLALAGAEMVFVPSDDSSMEPSYLPAFHAAHTKLRALEVGLPLVFLSNRGPSLVSDSWGSNLHYTPTNNAPVVERVSVPLVSETTAAARGGSDVLPLLGLIACIVVATRRLRVGRSPQVQLRKRALASHAAAGVLLAGVVGVAYEAVLLKRYRDINLSEAFNAFTESNVVVDELSSLFKQRERNTCGAAVLAFVLTRMSDHVSEADLVALRAPAGAFGYSFDELRSLALARGFVARGFEGTLEAIGRYTIPVIVHMRAGHFLALLSATKERVIFFDPSKGRVEHAPREQFELAWSKRFLVVYPQHSDAQQN